MIIRDGKKITAKQLARLLVIERLGGWDAFTENLEEAEKATEREQDEIARHVTKYVRRFLKQLGDN